MKRMTGKLQILGILLGCIVAVGCAKSKKSDSKKTDLPGKDPAVVAAGHPDKGPNGGELIEFGGNHDYHGEVVHAEGKDGDTVTIYILDGAGAKNVAIDAKEVTVNFKAHGKAMQSKLKAKAMEGDADGKSSRFVTVEDDEFAEHFFDKGLDAELRAKINGTDYRGPVPNSGGSGKKHVHKEDEKNHKKEDEKKK